MENIKLKEEFLDIKRENPNQDFAFSEEPTVDNYRQIGNELAVLESKLINAIITAAAGKLIYGNPKVYDRQKVGPYRVNLKRERYDNSLKGHIQFSVTRDVLTGRPYIDNPDGLFSTRGLGREWVFVNKDPRSGKLTADVETAEKVKSLLNKYAELVATYEPVRIEAIRQAEIATAEAKKAKARERRQIAQNTINRAKKIMDGMSKEDKEIVKNWVLNTVTRVEFLIPCGEIDIVGSSKETKRAEELTKKLDEKRIDFFNNYGLNELDFLDDMETGSPVVLGDVTLKWRNASIIAEKHLSNYAIWAVAGTMFLKDTLATAPEQVTSLIEKAKRITAKDSEEELAMKGSDKEIHSSVFCHAILLGLFEGNLNFLGNEATDIGRGGTLTGLDDTSIEVDADQESTIASVAEPDYDAIADEDPLGQDFPDVEDYDD